jgi:hypothetical protein
MLSLSSPSSRSDRDNQLTFSDEEAPSPRKTPAHRLCTYFVLWSFLFQTLWPSMVFARHEVALGSVWRTEQSGLTFQVESYRETGTSRKLIRVQAFSKEDEEEEAFTPAAKPAEDLGRSSPSASPRVFPPLALPEQKEVLVETPSAAAPSLTPPPSPLDESPPPSPRTALRNVIKKLLDRVVDIQTLQAVGSGVVLYNDLSIKAEGISWAFGGLAFVLDWQGNILTTGNAQFDMGVNIDAPGKVGLDNVSVKQLSARGQDVVVRGKGKIGRLDAWATGRERESGTFRITEDSEGEINQLWVKLQKRGKCELRR